MPPSATTPLICKDLSISRRTGVWCYSRAAWCCSIFPAPHCCPWSAKISRTARSPTALCSWRASSWSRKSWSRFWRRGLDIGPSFGAASRCCSPASPSKRRALLFTLVSDPLLMMVVQLLDGVTGAAVTVLTILVVTDLTTGTGRFNLAQGVLGTITGTAAAVSTGSVGVIVQQFGDLAGFLLMAATTTAGAALIWAFLPETKPAKYLD